MAHPQQHTDPVCGMAVDSDMAAARSDYEGTTFYFCSDRCQREFEAHPAHYTHPAASDPGSAPAPKVPLEQHEPPFTKSGGLVAPKFGAAGSGGAEYERLPEAHDDREAH